MIKNIISVDLEEHFAGLPFSTWQNYESRVISNTKIVLDLLKKYNTQATFFTLGYIAEKYPELIEEIKTEGHEIASHSYSHPDISKMSKKDFEFDLIKSLEILSKVSGEKILGFRAPFFSIKRNTFWAFDVLSKYVKYDSSIYPVGPHYGFADAPRHIYKISDSDPLKTDSNGKFIEIPLSTLRLPLIGNIPVAGGIYLRFFPLYFIKLGIDNLNKSGFSATCYIHPWDFDPNIPHLEGTKWHYYVGLDSSARKMESLLKNFNFSSARDVIKL